MSDEDRMDDSYGDGSEGVSLPKKRGFVGVIPPVVITILKWVFILLILIGTMILVSFIVNRVMNKSSNSNWMGAVVSSDVAVKPKKLAYFPMDQIRTRSADSNPVQIIVEPLLGYDADDTTTMSELIDRQVLNHDTIRSYFSTKRKAEIANEELIKRELKARLNQNMYTERIRDIAFKTIDVIE